MMNWFYFWIVKTSHKESNENPHKKNPTKFKTTLLPATTWMEQILSLQYRVLAWRYKQDDCIFCIDDVSYILSRYL